MKLKPILIGLMLLVCLVMPALAADTHDGDGEENVTITHTDGSITKVADNSIGIIKSDSDTSSKDSDSDDSDSSDSDGIDVWGIQQSDISVTNYADLGFLGRIYSGVTPLRNVSFLGIAVAFGLALTSVIGGAFVLSFIAGIGGLHPNTKKGMDMIHGARGRLFGIFGVFFIALFLIVLTFFFIAVFQKISLFVV